MARIVVGYDGSASATAAVHWAGREAMRIGAEVLVIQSWTDPMIIGPTMTAGWMDPAGAELHVRAELRGDVAVFSDEHPEVHFEFELVGELAATALIEAAGSSTAIVVGSRGRGGFASLLLGSVSQRVAAMAPSTVVVIRGDETLEGDVVVGVDGSAAGRVALQWAADAARRRSCTLRVVMAWSSLVPQGERGPEPFRATYTDADARRVLGSIVDDELGTEPDVTVDLQAVHDLATRALLDHGRGAALLVVGPHGLSRHPGLEIGSVTLQVLHHAPCPVAVVRAAGQECRP